MATVAERDEITPKKIYLNLNQKKMARDTFSMALELESAHFMTVEISDRLGAPFCVGNWESYNVLEERYSTQLAPRALSK
ncbi:hypothetical protein ACLB2K_077257 [Fragaria x ananassa]